MNPSGSSQLDLLEFPEEWNLQQKETSTDYLRDADNPKREQLVRVPTDGSTFIWNAPFKPLSVDIINSSGQPVNITDDTGDKIQIAGGSFVSMPVNGALHYTFQLASADNTGRACFCIFYRYRRNVAGASAAGGAAASVTIAGPLDGSGNVKTALEAAIPGGTNTIGNVELIDGVGGVNKATIDASNNLHTFISSGQVTAFGSNAAALHQGGTSNNTITAEDGAPVGATSQITVLVTTTTVVGTNTNRKQLLIVNQDATNPVYVCYGAGPATTTNGFILFAKSSVVVTFKGAIQAIATGGSVIVGLAEESWN